MDLKDLYQQLILDHGKNPRNLGKFENFNKDAKGHNPLCGEKFLISNLREKGARYLWHLPL